MALKIVTGGTTCAADGTLVSSGSPLVIVALNTAVDAHIRCDDGYWSADQSFDVPAELEVSFNGGSTWYGNGDEPITAPEIYAVNYPIKIRQTTAAASTSGSFVTDGTYTAIAALSTPTLTATVRGNTQIDLSWTNVSNEDASPGYTLQRSTAADFSANLVTVTKDANVTTHSATGLSAGTRYYFRVKAEGSGRYSDSAYGTDDDTTAPTIAEAILALSPLTYYKLDESSGTSLNDSGSLNNDATLSGGVTLAQTGPRGASDAVLIDSANERIEAPNSSSLRFTGTAAFTLSAWVKVASVTGATRALIQQTKPTTPYQGWSFDIDAAGKLSVGRFGGSAPYYTFSTSASALPNTSWHHVAATFDGDEWRFYIDGALDGSAVAATRSIDATTTQQLQVGNYEDTLGGDLPFLGNLAHVAIFNTALSLANIQSIYNGL